MAGPPQLTALWSSLFSSHPHLRERLGTNLLVPVWRDLAPPRIFRSKPAEVFRPAHCQNNLVLDRYGLFSLAQIHWLPDSGDLLELLRKAVAGPGLAEPVEGLPGSRRLHPAPETKLT
jgi:hypothetical protein